MSQPATWGSFTSGPKTQAQIGAQDNETFAAILSQHAGASRPSYAVMGTIWAKDLTGSSPARYELYIYNGTSDVLLGTMYTASNVYAPVIANVSATDFLAAMPAGTVVQKVVSAIGSNFTTTKYGTDFATVITQSFTPKFASSKILVTLCGRNNYAHRDYGSAVADGDVRCAMRIKDGTTTPNTVTPGGIMASTRSDGDMYAWFPGFMPQPFDAGSTNARTYTAEAAAGASGTDVAILSPFLVIEEIKQ